MTETFKLFEHQKKAVGQLRNGSVLCGSVGTGKSLTALYYYNTVVCDGEINGIMKKPKDLFIITTAAKRDTLDWERECGSISLSIERTKTKSGVRVVVDSWNNIGKYTKVTDAFFIFDEQRVVGSGAWVKSFLKITKANEWILLSATPGDTWIDYIPVFIANGFYRNRTEFLRNHVVYNTFTKFPKIDRYVEIAKLQRLKSQVLIMMTYAMPAKKHFEDVAVNYDKELYDQVALRRWNPFENRPVKEVGEYIHLLRKVVNSDLSRYGHIEYLHEKHKKLIVFYNFNYELELLRKLKEFSGITLAEYNGHRHDPLPKGQDWVYLVQYTSGAEGWNCIETNAIAFYSLHYSYRMMTQAAGRIDRINTMYGNLYYYKLFSSAPIDAAINRSLKNKKEFNESDFIQEMSLENPRTNQ